MLKDYHKEFKSITEEYLKFVTLYNSLSDKPKKKDFNDELNFHQAEESYDSGLNELYSHCLYLKHKLEKLIKKLESQ
jgi:hypothetical protein